MKLIKIIILLSVFLGFSSVYAQTSNTETKKNDLEIKTEQVDPEIKTASQPQMLNAQEETPATAKVPEITSQKEKEVFVKTRPYPNEVTEAQLQYAKDNPSTTKDNRSKQQYTPANPDPNKKNLNVKNNNYD